MEYDIGVDYIGTSSGKRWSLENAEEYPYSVKEIALSLSRTCRFNGHGRTFYSVAEHCCSLADYALGSGHTKAVEYALAALLHDAHEAFVGDRPSPQKTESDRQQEDLVQTFILNGLGLEFLLKWSVKDVDQRLCRLEIEDLLPNAAWPKEEWVAGSISPLFGVFVSGWSPEVAFNMFMERYRVLRAACAVARRVASAPGGGGR